MECHGGREEGGSPGEGAVVLVGNPNVGKSVLFAALTGRYVSVSNYPGTTVEVARGSLGANGRARPVIDTPGIRSVVPFSDDERVARDILLSDRSATVVQVADAKNLRRSLLLSLELAEAGVPLVLALNMADEARNRGIEVDDERLSQILGVPVVSTVATKRVGVPELERSLPDARPAGYAVSFDAPIEEAVCAVKDLLPGSALRSRALALMLLSGDEDLPASLGLSETASGQIAEVRRRTERLVGEPLAYALNRRRLAAADSIVASVQREEHRARGAAEAIGRAATHPVAGWPILAAILALVFVFVGLFGAGVLVKLLEQNLFGEVVNPWATRLVEAIVPFELLQRFLVGEYGLITMALTYGLAIVLPVVATFFLAFGVLEDSGYMSRLAVMLDRGFRRMGLNGKAVLPMILGLGCVTMATISTRILETHKERIQVTLLLALSVPCSAQIGVILGMITATGAVGITIWSAVVLASLLLVGYLSARVIPGAPSDFVLELPPMRVPSGRNIAVKTAARVEWYLKEVIPVFVLGTAILFVLDETGLLSRIEHALSPVVVGWLGLPAAATGALLIGFLRRDYGAAGLFALALDGALSPAQVLVSLVVITLFVPCIASLLMIVREHGVRIATAVVAFVFVFALLVGGLLNLALEAFHVLA
jgi:ferrous iron transport protein B